jgi:hypothetical protein
VRLPPLFQLPLTREEEEKLRAEGGWCDRHHVLCSKANEMRQPCRRSYFDGLPHLRVRDGTYNTKLLHPPLDDTTGGYKTRFLWRLKQFPRVGDGAGSSSKTSSPVESMPVGREEGTAETAAGGVHDIDGPDGKVCEDGRTDEGQAKEYSEAGGTASSRGLYPSIEALHQVAAAIHPKDAENWHHKSRGRGNVAREPAFKDRAWRISLGPELTRISWIGACRGMEIS